jgi:hypothetical protein
MTIMNKSFETHYQYYLIYIISYPKLIVENLATFIDNI